MEDTNLRKAILYKAFHPSIDGVYIGCKLDSIDGYFTSSNCFNQAVSDTGVKPTLEVIEILEIDWDVEANRQLPYQRERELYDSAKKSGTKLLNGIRPLGVHPLVTTQYSLSRTGVELSPEHREKIGSAHRGIPKTKEHVEKIRKAKVGKTLGVTASKGKPKSPEHIEKMRAAKKGVKASPIQLRTLLASHRKVVSLLDGRVTTHRLSFYWNKKNSGYIGTWVEL